MAERERVIAPAIGRDKAGRKGQSFVDIGRSDLPGPKQGYTGRAMDNAFEHVMIDGDYGGE
ncbi:hypothetical protein DW2_02200 [Thioclava atlantica]|uniref:Uncharacterized protein n=1 Tax=Thioclava atlantica TaxID=1317124 RepID=A0A085U1T5_9RHOB|nr:hypothetical protein DW2_02200 [Thioclava atlantica]